MNKVDWHGSPLKGLQKAPFFLVWSDFSCFANLLTLSCRNNFSVGNCWLTEICISDLACMVWVGDIV